MSRRWVLEYPEAQGKYNTYNDVVLQLESYQLAIQTAAAVDIKSLNDFLDGSSVLLGTYYDTYDSKTTSWYDNADKISSEFNTFSSELTNRIITAISLRDMWKARINNGHWEVSEDEK